MDLSRRLFLRNTLIGSLAFPIASSLEAIPDTDAISKIKGLILGGMIGDALGGPIEFQDPGKIRLISDPPHSWSQGEFLNESALDDLTARCRLRSYEDLRPEPEPYAHWNPNAPPGTITDDTRHKLILLHGLRNAFEGKRWPLSLADYARSHLTWPRQPKIADNPSYRVLCKDWLEEWQQGARWVLGERDPAVALPPSRMWGGLPTCCGQMSLPPLACLYPGNPEKAYTSAYQLAFFDNGFGKDLNAGLVAGLATALPLPAEINLRIKSWELLFEAMRQTDPYRYGTVPWVKRPLDRWLDFALNAAETAQGSPYRLFEILEKEFSNTIKWEAQVPFVVAFACLALCDYQPLAAMQLSIEWGHDTDSYAALIGCFVGALHGEHVFPRTMREAVSERLSSDFGIDLDRECGFLLELESHRQSLRED